MVKFVARTVPLTSSISPGHAEPIPTLPPPLTIKFPPAAVHVPIPTLPLVTTNEPCGVVVPTPILPVKALTPLPLCVYAPDVVIPVTAVMAPVLLTVNAFAPTAKGADGAHVPIPTFPLVTTN